MVPLLVFTAAAQTDFLQSLTAVDLVASTVPANGDVNPYGVFIVPKSVGNLVKGNLLVSNFNNASNVQGNNPVLLILHTHTKKKKRDWHNDRANLTRRTADAFCAARSD